MEAQEDNHLMDAVRYLTPRIVEPNKPIVTKEWLAERIKLCPEKVIGRALAAIYKNQTATEQSNTTTIVRNGIGFTKPDARVGTIGARMFNAHGTLQPWVVAIWSRPAKDGFPRICKYANQLQAIAEARKAKLVHTPNFNLVIL